MTDFKVGDRVRAAGKVWGWQDGKEGVVTDRVGTSGRQFMRFNGSAVDWAFDQFNRPVELVEAANVAQEEANEVPADAINPAHYQGFSNGAQVIDITEHLTPNLANVVKYAARAGSKTPDPMEDLLKAQAYLNREINRLNGDPKW